MTRTNTNMFVSTLVRAALAAVLLAAGWSRGQGQHVAGFKMGLASTFFPPLIAGFTAHLVFGRSM